MSKDNPTNTLEAIEGQVTSGCYQVVVVGLIGSIITFAGTVKVISHLFPRRRKTITVSSVFASR